MKLTDYRDIGQYLHDSRESLRVTVEQAAQALHIRPQYIRALESGDLKDMPGKAYIRGYLRNYADFLRLNGDEVIEAYGSLLGPKRQQEFFIPEPTLRQNLPSNHLLWWVAAGMVVLYGCWYFGFHDRTILERTVEDLPSAFAHILEKKNHLPVSKEWEECLDQGDVVCFITLQTPIPAPQNVLLYNPEPGLENQ